MDLLQQRRFSTFDKVLGMARDWPAEMSEPEVVGALKDLKTVRDAVLERQTRLAAARTPDTPATDTRSLARTIREYHLMVLASAAAAYLTDEHQKPLRLKVPPFRATPGAVLKAVHEFDAALRPHLPTLIAKGLKPDVLDRMNSAGKELDEQIRNPSHRRQSHKEIRAEVRALIDRGRAIIELLGRLLRLPMKEKTHFGTQFQAAAKVSDKPGPPRAPTTARAQEARRRRRPKKKPHWPQKRHL